MEFLKKQKTISELEEERDRVTIEEETITKQAEITEREAVIRELKSRYGKKWPQILGISKFTDLSSLKSFLVSAKAGMEKQTATSSGTAVGKLYDFGKLPRA